MDYDESLRWLLTLPDFERTGDFADRPDVAPMLALLRELGDPHLGDAAPDEGSSAESEAPVSRGDRAELKLRRYCPTIHIAGSKGKGSTGAMIEAVLRAAGQRTGHYISPHLHRYTERIRIDGESISREGFASVMTSVREAIERIAPQFPGRHLLAFDALTAAAFVAFREASVDVQVIEVGLGGLLDSTNVFHVESGGVTTEDRSKDLSVRDEALRNHQTPIRIPHVCLMTPISLEHTAILGNTIQEIARQKAGIILDGCAVVVAPMRESAIDVFAEVAKERGAPFIEVAKACQVQRVSANAEGQDFRLKTPRETYAAHLPLAGKHQLDNAVTAIVACEELCERAGIELTPQHAREGLASVKWPGRLEVLKRRPWVIVDGAHNADSAKRMVTALRDDFGIKSAVFLFGTLAGKDADGMAEATAPLAEAVIVTAWPSARAADPRETAAGFRPFEAPVSLFASLPDAYESAVTLAGDRGAVVAFGALAFVAAVREFVLGIESDAVRLAVTPGN